jgi:hypothetical protein
LLPTSAVFDVVRGCIAPTFSTQFMGHTKNGQPEARGGRASTRSQRADSTNRKAEGKFLHKKSGLTRADVKRLIREQRRKQEALLKEWGVTERELKEWWDQDEASDREAAHDKAVDRITFETELCGDLINEHLSKVPKDKRGAVRDTLDDLVIALRTCWWQRDLSHEWQRDPKALLRLIAAAFDRWRKAHFERPLALHQLATNPRNKPKAMTSYLNEKKIGITELPKTAAQSVSRRNADRQELSRGRRAFRAPKEKSNL